MTIYHRNRLALHAAQEAFETPPDDEPEGWSECPDCHDCLPLGLNCITCDGKGGLFRGEPMSREEFRRFEDGLQAEAPF